VLIQGLNHTRSKFFLFFARRFFAFLQKRKEMPFKNKKELKGKKKLATNANCKKFTACHF